MSAAISVENVSKVYDSGFEALKNVNLEIHSGEIFALLGPNGAGKTTLISMLCGLVNPGTGRMKVEGLDVVRDYRQVRRRIGLVPQEISVAMFETVWDTVRFSRWLYGRPSDPAYLEYVLRRLSLWDKKDNRMLTLSGGMKRRVLIAKALAHQPRILFLDEPTAGVDVELRRDMWSLIRSLRDDGVTIILTTHYIEEAEGMADRVGVINQGTIVLVDETHALMRKLGRKQLTLELATAVEELPEALAAHGLELSEDGTRLIYTYDASGEHLEITSLLRKLHETGLEFRDLHTTQSSLEEIFVSLVEEKA